MTTEESEVKQKSHANGHRKKKGDEEGGEIQNARHKLALQATQMREQETDEVDISEAEQYIPTPPDGGWGWVIVGASLVCNLVVDGIGYAFGVYLLEFEDYFGESKGKITLVGSLLCGVYLFAGPVVSAMTNKLGCRPVVIAGSLMSSLAFVLATQATSVDMLIITYGCMGGFGFGMIYLPAIVSVGYYFEKNRAFATGLAVCGSGVGTFIFPPLTEWLVQLYGWQGSVLILAGIILNCCVCGCLMRPLEAKPVVKRRKLDVVQEESGEDLDRYRGVSESSTFTNTVDSHKITLGVLEAKLQREKRLQENDSDLGSLPSIAFVKRESKSSESTAGGGIPIPGAEARRYKTSIGSSYTGSTVESPTTPQITIDFPQTTEPEDKQSPELTDGTSTERSVYFTPPETNPNSPVKSMKSLVSSKKGENDDEEHEASETGDSGMDNSDNNTLSSTPVEPSKSTPRNISEIIPLLEIPAPKVHNGAATSPRHRSISGGSRTNMHLHSIRSLHSLAVSKGNVSNLSISKKDLARPLYRKDIFYSGSVFDVNQVHSQADMKSYIASITTIPGEMEYIDSPSRSSQCMSAVCFCLPRPVRDILSEMVDLSLLKDVSFMLICLGNFTAFLGFFSPFVFMVDVAVSLGIDKGNAAFLISIIGIANTLGRVLAGKLADSGLVSSLVITWVAIIICGISTAILPYCTTYAMLAVIAFIFGSGVAAYISLSSVIICDQMGLDKLTNAFGLMCLTRGTAGMIGPPFAGFLYDASGSYHLSFLVGGLLLFVGAFCHMLLHLPCLQKRAADHEILMVEEVEAPAWSGGGSMPQVISVEECMNPV